MIKGDDKEWHQSQQSTNQTTINHTNSLEQGAVLRCSMNLLEAFQ